MICNCKSVLLISLEVKHDPEEFPYWKCFSWVELSWLQQNPMTWFTWSDTFPLCAAHLISMLSSTLKWLFFSHSQNALDLTAPASDALLKNRKNAWVQLAGHPGECSLWFHWNHSQVFQPTILYKYTPKWRIILILWSVQLAEAKCNFIFCCSFISEHAVAFGCVFILHCIIISPSGSFAPAGPHTIWKKRMTKENNETVAYQALRHDSVKDLVPKFYREVHFNGDSILFWYHVLGTWLSISRLWSVHLHLLEHRGELIWLSLSQVSKQFYWVILGMVVS